jgi:hypothetical protein
MNVRRGGTKLWYRVGWRKLKGDAFVYRVSLFWFICKMQPSIACLPSESNVRRPPLPCVSHLNQMWDTPLWECLHFVTREMRIIESRLWFGVYALNISGPACSIPILSKISKRPTCRRLCPLIALDTAACRPWVFLHLDLSPRALCHPWPWPRARCCLNRGHGVPRPRAHRHHWPQACNRHRPRVRATRGSMPPSSMASSPPPWCAPSLSVSVHWWRVNDAR